MNNWLYLITYKVKEMKKTFFTLCTVFALSNLGAQSLQEGINHLYADRFKNAEQTFQKLLAANPNNADATYWLGQTYLDKDDNCLLYTSPSPRDRQKSRMPSSA